MPTVTFYETTDTGQTIAAIIALENGELVLKQGSKDLLSFILDYADRSGMSSNLTNLLKSLPNLYTGSYLRASYSSSSEEL